MEAKGTLNNWSDGNHSHSCYWAEGLIKGDFLAPEKMEVAPPLRLTMPIGAHLEGKNYMAAVRYPLISMTDRACCPHGFITPILKVTEQNQLKMILWKAFKHLDQTLFQSEVPCQVKA